MRLRSLFACALLGASFGAPGTTAGTAAAVTCVGDCGGDGKVTCAELMLGVNIALVAAGWYADYDLHRGDYAMSGLQQLPDGSWPLWTAPVADGSAIH